MISIFMIGRQLEVRNALNELHVLRRLQHANPHIEPDLIELIDGLREAFNREGILFLETRPRLVLDFKRTQYIPIPDRAFRDKSIDGVVKQIYQYGFVRLAPSSDILMIPELYHHLAPFPPYR